MRDSERVPARLQGEVDRGWLRMRPDDGEASTLTIAVFSLSSPQSPPSSSPKLGDDEVAYL